MSIRSDPGIVLPLAPMIYVAWADGVLSPEELRGIAESIRGRPWVTPDAREWLSRWLDPDAPPSAQELGGLLAAINAAADGLPESDRRSLVELGTALGRSGVEDVGWSSPEALDALQEVEAALGVVGAEAVRELGFATSPEAAPPPGPRLDVAALNLRLEPDDRDTRAKVFGILSQRHFRVHYEEDADTYRTRVMDWCRELADRGLGGLGFPERYGGAGQVGRAITVFETLAYHDLSLTVKFGVQFGLFGGSVYLLGTERHHERYLPRIASLELPGCFAMTEMGHGSNVRALETVARYDASSETFVVHTPSPSARKDWIGNAARHGRLAVVFAQLEVAGQRHGVHAFLVPIRDESGGLLPGVRIADRGHKAGLNGVDNGQLSFKDVRIPRENLLDRFGSVSPGGAYTSPIPSPGRRFFTMLGSLVAGRISIASASVSTAKTALTIALRHTDRRRQFGPAGGEEVPVLDYLTLQRRLLPRLATTYALHLSVQRLVADYATRTEAGRVDLQDVEGTAAGLKAYASRHALETLQAAREACGGRGYASENRLGRLREDVDIFTTFEGANVVLLQLVTKGLLTEYREEFGELRLWDVARLVGRRARTELAGRNPIAARRADEEHLLDPEFHAAAFRYREERLLTSVAQRLRSRMDEGMDSFHALNDVQDHVVTLARAHLERHLLEVFQEWVATIEDDALRPPLDRLAALFALSRIEAHAGWYQESGTMDGRKTKAVRAMVNRLCREIRPLAVSLVDGFGIPDAVLSAPIAEETAETW